MKRKRISALFLITVITAFFMTACSQNTSGTENSSAKTDSNDSQTSISESVDESLSATSATEQQITVTSTVSTDAPIETTTITEAPAETTTVTEAPTETTTVTEAPVETTTVTEAPVETTTVTDDPVETTKKPEAVTPGNTSAATAQFANVSTGEVTDLFNDIAVYSQQDGLVTIALGGHDVEGAEGCSIIGEVLIDAAICGSGMTYSSNNDYKAPIFYIHTASNNGPVSVDNVSYPDNFSDCYLIINKIDPLVEISFYLEIYFIGTDGKTYCFGGQGTAPFTEGAEPPQRVYDEICTVCNGTGLCRGCKGTGWFSTVGDGIRCNSCYNYSGLCIGCDGHGKH